ncbi:hypothetical protein HQO38_17590 [Rhodococcus fascians]|nr:hypothetical protein [Rhodococcus fascians]MBY4139213.1 hypothetical protein [Rhodococcus fascians]MBY4217680.1 hypothetical protein [Rhodococcus fascians]MBY4224582.1 hypothetical protein [Rhodococcus fascians]MBY4233732.1 hypothetical protein [Rhodococcus fascians]
MADLRSPFVGAADVAGRAGPFDTVTAVTLVIGVVVLRVFLFWILLLTACLTLPPGLLSSTLGARGGRVGRAHPRVGVASIATIGGALGSGLEDDDAVTEVAHGVRQRHRTEDAQRRSNETQ